jgi:CheY-like chemotaxis protein
MAQRVPTNSAVLVVEDEPLVLWYLIEQIEDEGLSVYGATNAAEAIKLMEAHEEIGVLLTDVEMPGSMDGLKLSHYVRGRWPPVKIFITSGRRQPLPQYMPTGAVFFDKPFREDDLRKVFDSART